MKISRDITFEIEKAWEKVIDQFYDSYEPSVYKRTYKTYEGSDKYEEVMSGSIQKPKLYKIR